MWLIDTTTLQLKQFTTSDQSYAILSHTWGDDGDEVSFEEFCSSERSATTLEKPGYLKIKKTCQIARDNYGLQYAWVDTCCIDKRSSAELSEAINSMFRWYKEAIVCFAFLADVGTATECVTFENSRWFTRGWTLQELIAPKEVVFFDCSWKSLGKKRQLAKHIELITRIPHFILDGSWAPSRIPVAARMSWASSRQTKREEDAAYSLMGLFDINMPMLYGEGRKAFMRLQEEIIWQDNDLSIFAWEDAEAEQDYCGILAASPMCFRNMNSIEHLSGINFDPEFSLSNRVIRFQSISVWINEADGSVQLDLDHEIRSSCGDHAISISLRPFGRNRYVRQNPKTYTKHNANHSAELPNQQFLQGAQIIKLLSSQESQAITESALSIRLPDEFKISVIEPLGCLDTASSTIHGSHLSTFYGYMYNQKHDIACKLLYDGNYGIWFFYLHLNPQFVSNPEQFYRQQPEKITSRSVAPKELPDINVFVRESSQKPPTVYLDTESTNAGDDSCNSLCFFLTEEVSSP